MESDNIRNSFMELNEVYFWTSIIVMWKHLLKQEKYRELIIESLKYLSDRKLISVYGYVVMPNHVHFIWEMLGKNNKEMPDSSFTKFTAHALKKDLVKNHPQVLNIFKTDKYDRDYQFWQRDPLAVRIFSKEMFYQKLMYIHLNTLSERWNLAKRPEEYYWFSANYYESGKDNQGFIKHYQDRF